VLLAGVGVSVAGFVVLAIDVHHGTPQWDARLLHALTAHGGLRTALDWLIRAAEGAGYAFGATVALLLLRSRRLTELLLYGICIGGGLLLVELLKREFHRHSLNYPTKGYTGYSFPSGHAIASVAVTLPAVFLLRRGRAMVPVTLLYVTSLGVALVARHAHWPSDVLAGWCVAVAWICLVWLVARRG
jgi:membrane-associated phospholipid phosphatase